jgi:aspartate/methionine/tyrosine aminotransferase
MITGAAACDSGSLMTLLERDAWLNPDPAVTDVTHGYLKGLTPAWMREYQVQPNPAGKFTGPHPPPAREWQLDPRAADFLDVPPGEYADVICGWFARFLGRSGIILAPSCTMAFVIAAQAVLEAGDKVIVLDCSYDSWPTLLRALGARVVFARRAPDGQPDLKSISAACTRRTRAIVIVSPDNPLGVVCPPGVLDELLVLCAERDMTLITDHCLAPVNPMRAHVPLVPKLAARRPLPWIALADTGKILGLGGTKLGALACAPLLRQRVEAAASAWFFQLPAYDLVVIAAILGDPRFTAYRLELSARIAGNYLRLRETQPPLTVAPLGAGPFALIDGAGLGLDDVTLTSLLRDRYRVLAVPVSWFPSGRPARETRVRVSLSRHPEVIERLAAALNALATSR